MAIVSTIDHTAYSPHLLLMSAVLAVKLPMKNASVSIMLIMNNIFIRLIPPILDKKNKRADIHQPSSVIHHTSNGLISPHMANRSKLPPQSVRIYSLAISTMSANVSVSLLPSAYTNVTLSSPIEQQAVTVCPDATAFR